MSENRDQEPRSWNEEEAEGDKAVADLKQSLSRLRGQVGAYRERVGDNENSDGNEGEGSEA